MKVNRLDKIVGLFFAVATVAIILIFFTNRVFFEWAFTRHQNTLSWYIRPLFIIPIVIGAYQKSYSIIFASIFSLSTSMFWFPKPAIVDESVIGYLNFEKDYLTSGWTANKIFVVIAVILFFIFLIYMTWQRKWKLLLWVVVAGAVLKIVHSVIFGGENGLSIVKPALLGLVICVSVIAFIAMKKKKK